MDPRIQAIVAVVMFLIFIIVIIYTVIAYISAASSYKKAKRRLQYLVHNEKLARLRHRDLEAFTKELNILRAKKGKRGIPKATLAKVQYNLMYSIDEV